MLNSDGLYVSDEVEQMIVRAGTDLRYCGKFYFPHIFESPYSTLHHQAFDHLEKPDKKKDLAAPRGIGKTSIARLIAKRAIIYRTVQFIVYISRSATHAITQTENIKRELLSNDLIKKCFGSIKISDEKIEGFEDEFSKAAWVAFGNTLILPRGAGQQVRGLNWNNVRPQLYIIDDLEDKDEVKNPENRQKIDEWFNSDVEKSVNQYKKDYNFVYIDTIKHEDSQLAKLQEAPDWCSLKLSLCDENYKSYDQNYMTDAEIMKEIETHRKKGLMDIFYMEFMNEVISKEDASFKEEYFRYYNMIQVEDNDLVMEHKVLNLSDEQIQNDSNVESVVIMDPAKTVNMQSAESAIVGIGIDTVKSRLLVRDIIHDKFYPDELYNQTFLMAQRLGAHAIGIETTGLEEFIKQPIENEMLRRGIFFNLVWLKARGGRNTQRGKEERISALVPYYRQGLVYHNWTCCAPLEQQLLVFPRSKLWDIMDAFAYIVEMLDLGARFFQPPLPANSEDEFADLEYDEPVQDWRII
jgi:hypothetical protein